MAVSLLAQEEIIGRKYERFSYNRVQRTYNGHVASNSVIIGKQHNQLINVKWIKFLFFFNKKADTPVIDGFYTEYITVSFCTAFVQHSKYKKYYWHTVISSQSICYLLVTLMCWNWREIVNIIYSVNRLHSFWLLCFALVALLWFICHWLLLNN